MLFLSYHQLHHGPTEAPHRDGAGAGAGAGGVRFSLSNVFFSLGVMAPRRDAAPEVVGSEGRTRRDDAGGEEETAAALEGKFEEALRLSCWSS